MKKRLLLFDIDGTLMLSGGAGGEALNRAIHDVTGVPNAMEGVSCAGRIDPLIVRDALLNAGISSPEAILTQYELVMQRYFVLLPGVIKELNKARVLLGVVETLDWLMEQPAAVLAVATGNAKPSADIKLSSVGLLDYFCVGGYGDDGTERFHVLQSAHQRAATLGCHVEAEDVLVIGDTVHDVTAAHKAGMQVAAVATGYTPYEALQAASPNYCWETMREGLQWFRESGFFE